MTSFFDETIGKCYEGLKAEDFNLDRAFSLQFEEMFYHNQRDGRSTRIPFLDFKDQQLYSPLNRRSSKEYWFEYVLD